MRLWNWLRWKLGYEVRVPEDYPTLLAAYYALDKRRDLNRKYNKMICICVARGHVEPINACLHHAHLISYPEPGTTLPIMTIGDSKPEDPENMIKMKWNGSKD